MCAVVMSGIQPTGDIHIGNYLGALRNWVAMTAENECYYVIVDYHAITIEYDTATFQQNVFDAALVNAACGLEPGTCLLFVQSQVPEHTELAWVFNSLTMVGRLTNMTQFKEKSQQHSTNINAGLLTYPILQAADILIYKATEVPVGEDQHQHLELTREIARRFNYRFGETFPEPRATGGGLRILGLDGSGKMSQSKGNTIGVLESAETIWEKLRPAVTDVARVRRSDPGNPYVCNIFSLHEHFSTEQERAEIYQGCTTAGIGCIDCKRILHRNIVTALAPIQERYEEYRRQPDVIRDFLADSARKARAVARQTMAEVREKMGIGKLSA